MNTRKILLLIVAFLIASGTVIFAHSVLNSQKPIAVEAKVETPTTSEILVAARDVASGEIIKDFDLKWQAWPRDNVSDSFFSKEKDEMSAAVGAVVRQGFRSGDPIMKGRLIRSSDQGFLAAVLMPGLRAISVQLTPASGVAGLVFPGDRVDVIVAHRVQNPSGDQSMMRYVSETVVSDVRVLALDQKTSDQSREPKIAQLATLEVTPRQAEAVALVREMGTVSLVLRGIVSEEEKHDGISVSTGGLTWDSDVSQVVPEPANRRGQIQRVQVMRGKDKTESVFGAP